MQHTPTTFYRRRLGRYLPQLLVWSAVYLLLAIHFDDLSATDVRKHIQWLLFAPTFTPAWFLYALTGLYLIAPVIAPWLEKATRRQTEWFLAAWLFSGLTLLALEHIAFPAWQSPVAPFFGYLGYMVAGYYLWRWPLHRRSARAQLLFWVVVLLLGVAYGLRMFVTATRWGFADIMGNDLSINIMAMCMVWFALCTMVPTAPRVIRAVVTTVSTASLGIYLWHWALLQYAFPPGTMADALRFALALTLSLVLTLAGKYFFAKLHPDKT